MYLINECNILREMYNESIFYHFCGYKDSRFLKVKK